MDYKIEVKNVAPIKVVETCEQILYSQLRTKTLELYSVGKKNISGDLIALVHEPEMKTESPVTPCFPIAHGNLDIDKNLYQIQALQRIQAVTTLHYGDYDKLELAFEPLLEYLQKNNKTIVLPIRIIFHKGEKLHGFFKRKSRDYVTEIQIPFEQ